MKKLIEETRLKLADFAQVYSIPYNTVRQWYNGDRKCPTYVIKMIKEIMESRKKGVQLEIYDKKEYFCCAIDKQGKTGVYRTEIIEQVKKWKENVSKQNRIYWIEEHHVKNIELY